MENITQDHITVKNVVQMTIEWNDTKPDEWVQNLKCFKVTDCEGLDVYKNACANSDINILEENKIGSLDRIFEDKIANLMFKDVPELQDKLCFVEVTNFPLIFAWMDNRDIEKQTDRFAEEFLNKLTKECENKPPGLIAMIVFNKHTARFQFKYVDPLLVDRYQNYML